MRQLKLFTFLLLLYCFMPQCCFASNSFLEERYRGWLWFEEQEKLSKEQSKQTQLPSHSITPQEAEGGMEELKKELDAKRFVMMARPSPESVRDYKKIEKKMWDKAFKLQEAFDMANLLYPDQQDLINNPVNVHAVKMKRAVEEEKKQKEIAIFASKFDLVLFFSSDCKYCEAFSPVLQSFGQKYGFNIEAISMDGSKHEFFKTVQAPNLVEKLGIEAAPTVVAISHDSKTAFELIRGFVSLSELEDYSWLAIKHLKGIGKW